MSKYQAVSDLQSLYGSTNQIQSRGQFLKKYSVRDASLHDYVLEAIENLQEDIRSIIDIGAGTGSMLRKLYAKNPEWKYAALDIAPNEHLASQDLIDYRLYDGMSLPDFSVRFDLILMMHMLYHVIDVPSFLKEVKHHYASDAGYILVTTKSRHTMPGMERLFREALSQSGVIYSLPPERDEAQFCIENADEILKAAFEYGSINTRVITTELVVDSADDLLAYILSTPRYSLDESTERDVYVRELRRVIAAHLPFEDSYTEALYVIT